MNTTSTAGPTRQTAAPQFVRLIGTEFRRLAARRFTRILLGVCLIGYVVAVAYLFRVHAQPTAADFAQATIQRDQQISQIAVGVDQCIKAPGGSAEQCGAVPTAADFPVDQFLANDPFRPDLVPDYTGAVAAAVALAAFALGATFIGAEWSSRNVVAWLFFEPRRLRLMAAKLLAVTAAVLALSLVAQLIWAFTARWLINARGIPVSSLGDRAAQFWPDVLGVQIRAALLAVPILWLGFGLANLIRNTAAALGIAFVYLAVVESVVRAISPALQPYLLLTDVSAWVAHGGITVDGAPVYNQELRYVAPQPIHLSNLHGGAMVLLYDAVVLLISLVLFQRRDIT